MKLKLLLSTFRVTHFSSESELHKVLKDLSKPNSITGMGGIFVGGLNKLIKSARGNWRKCVDYYVEEVTHFARVICSPTVIIQLPFRNDSSGILRDQREQVRSRVVYLSYFLIFLG